MFIYIFVYFYKFLEIFTDIYIFINVFVKLRPQRKGLKAFEIFNYHTKQSFLQSPLELPLVFGFVLTVSVHFSLSLSISF